MVEKKIVPLVIYDTLGNRFVIGEATVEEDGRCTSTINAEAAKKLGLHDSLEISCSVDFSPMIKVEPERPKIFDEFDNLRFQGVIPRFDWDQPADG